jgi:hypothetical protein
MYGSIFDSEPFYSRVQQVNPSIWANKHATNEVFVHADAHVVNSTKFRMCGSMAVGDASLKTLARSVSHM